VSRYGAGTLALGCGVRLRRKLFRGKTGTIRDVSESSCHLLGCPERIQRGFLDLLRYVTLVWRIL
jgi:hypothetical protein